jgi:hypothetical protein
MDTFARVEEDTTRTWSNVSILPEESFRSLMVGDSFYGVRHFATTRSTQQDVDAARHSGAVELTELASTIAAGGVGASGRGFDGAFNMTFARGGIMQPNAESKGKMDGRIAAGGKGEIPSLQLVSRGLQHIRRPLKRMVRVNKSRSMPLRSQFLSLKFRRIASSCALLHVAAWQPSHAVLPNSWRVAGAVKTTWMCDCNSW